MLSHAALSLAACASRAVLWAQADPSAAEESFARGHQAMGEKAYGRTTALWDQPLGLNLWDAHDHANEWGPRNPIGSYAWRNLGD